MPDQVQYSNPVSAFFGFGGSSASSPVEAPSAFSLAPSLLVGAGPLPAPFLATSTIMAGAAAAQLYVDIGSPGSASLFEAWSAPAPSTVPGAEPASSPGLSQPGPIAAGNIHAGATSIKLDDAGITPLVRIPGPAAPEAPAAAAPGSATEALLNQMMTINLSNMVAGNQDAERAAQAEDARAIAGANRVLTERGLGEKGFGFKENARISGRAKSDLGQVSSDIESLSSQLGLASSPSEKARIRAELNGKVAAYDSYRGKIGEQKYHSFLKTYTNDGDDLGVDWMLVAGLSGLVTPFLTLGLESYLAGEREDKMMKYNASLRAEDRAHEMEMLELRGQQQLAAIGESNKKPGGSTATSAAGNLGGAFASA